MRWPTPLALPPPPPWRELEFHFEIECHMSNMPINRGVTRMPPPAHTLCGDSPPADPPRMCLPSATADDLEHVGSGGLLLRRFAQLMAVCCCSDSRSSGAPPRSLAPAWGVWPQPPHAWPTPYPSFGGTPLEFKKFQFEIECDKSNMPIKRGVTRMPPTRVTRSTPLPRARVLALGRISASMIWGTYGGGYVETQRLAVRDALAQRFPTKARGNFFNSIPPRGVGSVLLGGGAIDVPTMPRMRGRGRAPYP